MPRSYGLSPIFPGGPSYGRGWGDALSDLDDLVTIAARLVAVP